MYHTHPPFGPILPLGRCLRSSWNSVGIKDVGVVNISSRELSEDVSFGIATIGTLLVVEQSCLENHPRGGG